MKDLTYSTRRKNACVVTENRITAVQRTIFRKSLTCGRHTTDRNLQPLTLQFSCRWSKSGAFQADTAKLTTGLTLRDMQLAAGKLRARKGIELFIPMSRSIRMKWCAGDDMVKLTIYGEPVAQGRPRFSTQGGLHERMTPQAETTRTT